MYTLIYFRFQFKTVYLNIKIPAVVFSFHFYKQLD